MKSKLISVRLGGIRPIMFDRYVSMTGTEVPVEQKFYLDGKKIVFPSTNIVAFLTADLTESATKRLMGRQWRAVAKAALSFVLIEPDLIPITRDGKQLTLDNSNWYEHRAVARVKKSGGLIVPSEKLRPVIPLPWEMEFKIRLFENDKINETILRRIFAEGGITVGLGTYRGLFGKFEIEKWE